MANLRDPVTDSIVGALGIDLIAAMQLIGGGALAEGAVALGFVGAIYCCVYRNRWSYISTARRAAAILAFDHAVVAAGSLMLRNPFGLMIGGTVAACLGYASVQLARSVRVVQTDPAIRRAPQWQVRRTDKW